VIGRQLGRAGLRATRLDDLGLARLYHTSWAPEVARAQRLRRELSDYSALVVGAGGGGISSAGSDPLRRGEHGADYLR
jgi:hypothetical protein